MLRSIIDGLSNLKTSLEKIEEQVKTDKSEVNSEWKEVKSIVNNLADKASSSFSELSKETKENLSAKYADVKHKAGEQVDQLYDRLKSANQDLDQLMEKARNYNLLDDDKKELLRNELKEAAQNLKVSFNKIGDELKEISHEVGHRAENIKSGFNQPATARASSGAKRTVDDLDMYQSTVGDV